MRRLGEECMYPSCCLQHYTVSLKKGVDKKLPQSPACSDTPPLLLPSNMKHNSHLTFFIWTSSICCRGKSFQACVWCAFLCKAINRSAAAPQLFPVSSDRRFHFLQCERPENAQMIWVGCKHTKNTSPLSTVSSGTAQYKWLPAAVNWNCYILVADPDVWLRH